MLRYGTDAALLSPAAAQQGVEAEGEARDPDEREQEAEKARAGQTGL